ncbi:hypothetical protein ElyMa_005660800 [Elysia marginata]|uniref:Spondin domain-containing protein n=1 Tax=Elysia marginata TaxID=1093978 RepID=A0AAV4FEF7_9GAST|nr:hypothetical protein ElyMa_005660800 [Elysia marginata]
MAAEKQVNSTHHNLGRARKTDSPTPSCVRLIFACMVVLVVAQPFKDVAKTTEWTTPNVQPIPAPLLSGFHCAMDKVPYFRPVLPFHSVMDQGSWPPCIDHFPSLSRIASTP